ncbi:hypothetical protein C5748_16740 [Phyllobacterium phragmitis]|uniref:DUF1468 domain-containing protein n=1 Tax=Phyllobacterium phragmitis TaxID=2670329 RepID=A0A2S9IPH5_9HYPH|nr:tripartite tricarboxylate transporter TctB family protein [Phyllobacterium phragmitis]PRD42427.1 hypothetical protein C5748_16740 [Phyllobacterium phragmitis]
MAMRRLQWKNRLLLPLFLFVLTTVYIAAALQIQPQFSEGLVGPGFMPLVTAFIMYAALARVIWNDLAEEREKPEGSLLPPFLIVLATILYIIAFKPLGYSAATFLFVLALFHLFQFQEGQMIKRLLYAVAVTAIFYGLFALAFGIRLPTLIGVI